MTKHELRLTLEAIAGRYEATEDYPGSLDNSIGVFVDCLDNPKLSKHLLDTELCPCESELKESLDSFKDAKGIIYEYEGVYECLEELGLVALKQPKKPRLEIVK